MLQINVIRSNYKFFVHTYIQLSLSLMYVFTRLARIDISVVKPVTIDISVVKPVTSVVIS